MSKGRLHFANRKELLIILIFLAATAITAFASHNNVKKGSVAVIQCGNTVYTADLSVSGEFSFDECRDTVFEINGGKIRIKSAPCKDKICVNTGFIGSPGQCIICVPQKIIITVKKDSDGNSTSADVTAG